MMARSAVTSVVGVWVALIATFGASEPVRGETLPTANVTKSRATSEGLFRLDEVRRAMSDGGLGGTQQLSVEKVEKEVALAERLILDGRRGEAISLLAILVEGEQFSRWAGQDSGRAATFLLGDALGEAGAATAARVVLLRLVRGKRRDSWYRRAVMRLVHFAQQSAVPEQWARELQGVSVPESKSATSDLAYLRALTHERAARHDQAIAHYAKVGPESKYWGSARYRRGLLAVAAGRYPEAERDFCKVAEPSHTPRIASLTGGRQFFEVRDLSRLALGRVAHELSRFDDARYYFHQVPGDSELLPQALYEAATSRYEAKDYEAAHALLDELRALGRSHPYEDEAWILEAYVNLARCQFGPADALLQRFSRRYQPVLTVVERLLQDPPALRTMLRFVETRDESQLALIGIPLEAAKRVAALMRVDPSYAFASRQLTDAHREASGLKATSRQLKTLQERWLSGEGRSAAPQVSASVRPPLTAEQVGEQLASTNFLLRELESSGSSSPSPDLLAFRREQEALERGLQRYGKAKTAASAEEGGAPTNSLDEMMRNDLQLVAALQREVVQAGREQSLRLTSLARDALERVKYRLSRLMLRAQTGRVETVLGAKMAVELEIEALSEGLLPQGAVDSLDVAQFLQDDEEYWPIDGEDWADEYVGGEGLQ